MVVSCEHVWREVSNYIDGELGGELCAAIQEHVRGCQRCRSVLEGTRNVVTLYGDERMIEVPAGFSRRLQTRLKQSTRPPRWLWLSAWLVPVAAALILAGWVQYSGSRGRDQVLKTPHAQSGKNVPAELQVVMESGARIFHLAGCGVIRDRQHLRTVTAKRASEEGLTPCPRCLGKYLNSRISHRTGDLDLDADGRLPVLQAGF